MAEISKIPVSDFDAAVRLLSNGTNVAIYNDLGLPSVYVRLDAGTIGSVIKNGSDNIHPAFIVGGVEVPAFYMGKYLASVYKGRALSLPLQNPTTKIVTEANRGTAPSDSVNFDNSKLWCEANGPGFHLATLPEYAWVALKSKAAGTLPRGNNNSGSDVNHPYESGVAALYDGGAVGCTLTGSGPATWNHNWKPDGICDLNGNVYEFQGGYRLVYGELQIFENNDAALQYSQNNTSYRWRAILEDGSLVDPGSWDTLKWDYKTDPNIDESNTLFVLSRGLMYPQSIASKTGYSPFYNLSVRSGAIPDITVPELLKALALMPDGSSAEEYGKDNVYIRNMGECVTYRGGGYKSGENAGVFFTFATERETANASVGFRPAFIPGI